MGKVLNQNRLSKEFVVFRRLPRKPGPLRLETGEYDVAVDLPKLPLRPGAYELSVALVDTDAGKVASRRLPREITVTTQNQKLTSLSGGILEMDCGMSVKPLAGG